eukprot:12287-Heterococcus_DN1.PRE.12
MSTTTKGDRLKDGQKSKDIRISNIIAAKAVADAVRTSLGPRGMDKMIQKGDGEVIITNDGATILSQMHVFHPTAKMLVELSKSQDIEAGDGTTSVCVIAGALLQACNELLGKGIHPMAVADAFLAAVAKAESVLEGMSRPVDLADRATLIKAVDTCLSSKVRAAVLADISITGSEPCTNECEAKLAATLCTDDQCVTRVVGQNADTISPIAVDAVLRVIDPLTAINCDLRDIKVHRNTNTDVNECHMHHANSAICKQLGGTIDDTELVDGLVFEKGVKKTAGGPTRVENAKIGLIQFCLSAPKTDMENNVVVSDYAAMDRILREERKCHLESALVTCIFASDRWLDVLYRCKLALLSVVLITGGFALLAVGDQWLKLTIVLVHNWWSCSAQCSTTCSCWCYPEWPPVDHLKCATAAANADYVLGQCKKLKKAGCNVLLIQKSILRDAYNDLSLHFLAKMDIMVVTDVERPDIDFIARTLGCRPVAHIDSFTPDKLGTATLVAEVSMPGSGHKVVKCTGVPNPGRTTTVLVRGSNRLVLDEAERSIHDALCVVRSLVKRRFLIAGGGAAETEMALRLNEWSKTLTGMQAYCVKAYAEALEHCNRSTSHIERSSVALAIVVVARVLSDAYLLSKTVLASSCKQYAVYEGLLNVAMVTELRAMHGKGVSGAGINVRSVTAARRCRSTAHMWYFLSDAHVTGMRDCGEITDMYAAGVIQPMLVSCSAIKLATECVGMILKIDDVVAVMRSAAEAAAAVADVLRVRECVRFQIQITCFACLSVLVNAQHCARCKGSSTLLLWSPHAAVYRRGSDHCRKKAVGTTKLSFSERYTFSTVQGTELLAFRSGQQTTF